MYVHLNSERYLVCVFTLHILVMKLIKPCRRTFPEDNLVSIEVSEFHVEFCFSLLYYLKTLLSFMDYLAQ
jgi:hypothetical protein